MSLAPRLLRSPEAREARAHVFLAGAQQRKLAISSPVVKIPAGSLPENPPAPPTAVPQDSEPAATSTAVAPAPTDRVYPDMLESAKTRDPIHIKPDTALAKKPLGADGLNYIQYSHDLEAEFLPAIRALISKDLSEPYSIYVYRYFLYQWSHLCFMALDPASSALVGVIICKLEMHSSHSPETWRGYIAMLAVAADSRGKGIATRLVKMAIDAMSEKKADEIVLETEESNKAGMRLYERLGFLRSKKLHRYYLNGSSAYRLVLNLKGRGENLLYDSSRLESIASHGSSDPPAGVA